MARVMLTTGVEVFINTRPVDNHREAIRDLVVRMEEVGGILHALQEKDAKHVKRRYAADLLRLGAEVQRRAILVLDQYR